MLSDVSNSDYIPGICNIGSEERTIRRNTGYVSLILSIILILLLIELKASKVFNLIIFFPILLASISFLQDQMHFCAAFGLKGVYNFGKKILKPARIEELEYIKKDREKALKIIIYSLIISFTITFLLYFLI